MSSPLSTGSQQVCEDILIHEKRYNDERNILPIENAVADRLLARGNELKSAYEEMHGKLRAHPPALHVFIGLVLSTAAFWSPSKIVEAREARRTLASVNQKISKKAAELATLLGQRSMLHNSSGFSSDTHHHVCDVIEDASRDNSRYKAYVHDRLNALSVQFDPRYWPSLSEFVQALSSDAEDAVMEATDPLTAAATDAKRSSLADFLKALFAAIEQNDAENNGRLPRAFKLSDKTLASLTNCALDLGPEDLVDDAYVKAFRQRERNGTP